MAAPTFLICVITSYAALASGADLCYTSGNGQEVYCDGGVCTGSSCLSAGEIVGFVMAGLTVLLLIGCLVKCCFCKQGGGGGGCNQNNGGVQPYPNEYPPARGGHPQQYPYARDGYGPNNSGYGYVR